MTECTVIDRLRPGDHVCWTFDDDTTRDQAWTAYVRSAVRQQHKVLYLTDEPVSERCRQALADDGIELDELLRDRQLEMRSAREGYLPGGRFDSAATIADWRGACRQARAEGFAALRALGDMAWAVTPAPGIEELSGYEAQVNEVYAECYAMALCLYDRRLFDDDRLRDVMQAHPGTMARCDVGELSAWDPLLRMRWLDDAPGLSLVGEADLSNRAALRAVLERLGDHAGPVPVVEVSALRFLDVSAAHALVMAAARTGALRVRGASPSLTRLLLLVGADRVPGLTVEPESCARPCPA